MRAKRSVGKCRAQRARGLCHPRLDNRRDNGSMAKIDEKYPNPDRDSEIQRLLVAGKLLTVKEASALTGIGVWGIYQRIKRGKCRVWGSPRAQRVCIDDLLPQMKYRSKPGPKPPADSRRHWWQAVGD